MRLISLALAAALLIVACPAWAAPAIDASGASKGTFHGTTSGTVSITTTSGNVVIILAIIGSKPGATVPAVSTVSGGSLTWALRASIQSDWTSNCDGGGNPCSGDIEEWWAFSSSALSAATITVTFASSIDDAILIAFGVTGVGSSSAPFDSDGSLPATAANTGSSSTSPAVTLSTTQSSDLGIVIAGYSNNFAAADQTCSTTTKIYGQGNTAGTGDAGLNLQGAPYSSPQTGLSQTVCGRGALSGGWTVIGDAVTAGTVPAASNSMMLKSGPW